MTPVHQFHRKSHPKWIMDNFPAAVGLPYPQTASVDSTNGGSEIFFKSCVYIEHVKTLKFCLYSLKL
jgi:hypothetical protein